MFGATYVRPGEATFNFEGDWIIGKPFAPVDNKAEEIAALLKTTFRIVVSENIIGMKLVKAHRSEIPIGLQGKKYFADLRKLHTTQVFYSYLTSAFTEPAGFTFIAVLWLSREISRQDLTRLRRGGRQPG